MTHPLFTASNISKAYDGVQALDDVSLSIAPGEIHCLAGENGSGKSTLVKIAAGVVRPDTGSIVIDGHPVHIHSYHALDAIKAGIQVIYQDLSLFPHLSAAENIALNKLIAEKHRLVSRAAIHRIARHQLDQIGASIDPAATVQELPVASRQLVAICRALTLNARLIFMDEPTTALSGRDVDHLLSVVMGLKKKGISVVFISHKLDEIFRISDNVTVFRNGRGAGPFPAASLTPKTLARHMTGRDIEHPRYRRDAPAVSPPILKLTALSKRNHFENINLIVRPGDIVGVTGLVGSGRAELALALFGLNPPDSGKVRIDGRPVSIRSPSDAIRAGIALLPDDRTTAGLFMDKSIKENVTSAILGRIKGKFGVIDRKKQTRQALDAMRAFDVRAPSIDISVRALSGGNAQKIAIAKWTATTPRLFVLNMPTVGVDIGAKSEIYTQIQRFASDGMGIVLISDEIDELVANCNHVAVMAGGRIVAALGEAAMRAEPGEIRARLNELIYKLW